MMSGAAPPACAAPHVTWDEAAILRHQSEAGVLYGTQRVEEAVTPFLYSGVETPEHSGPRTEEGGPGWRTIGEHVPGEGRREVNIDELRARLGVCLEAMRDPPPPWLKMKSRSEDPGETFYFNPATGETSWDFPEEEGGEEGVGASVLGRDDECEEDEPIVSSRLTRARDCAAEYAAKHR